MPDFQLTSGCVVRMKNGDKSVGPCVVQIVKVTTLDVAGERYRLEISDGLQSVQVMLATQFNRFVKGGEAKEFSVLKITEFIANEVQGKKIVIILGMEVIGQSGALIGRPVDSTMSASGPPPLASSNVVNAPPQAQQRVYAPQNAAPAAQQNQSMQNRPVTQHQQQPQYTPQSYQQNQPSFSPAPAQGKPMGGAVVGLSASMGGGGQRMGGGSMGGGGGSYKSIKALNPYQNKWMIKARVTNKSDVRTWDKGANNQGKLFSADLVDAEGSEIRATFFKEAVDMFYDQLAVGRVYTFGEGKVKVANKQFTTIKCEYELSFGKEAQIQIAPDDGAIAKVSLTCVTPISEIERAEPKTTVDVVGVAISIGEVSSFTSKQGKDLRKLEFELVDESMVSVKVSAWGTKADEVAAQFQTAGINPIVAIKGALVGEFNGKNLSTGGSTTVLVNAVDVPQVGRLRMWFDQGGANAGVRSLTQARDGSGGAGGGHAPTPFEERFTFDLVRTLGLGRDSMSAGDYVDVKATIQFLSKQNLWYPACPTDKCGKKLSKTPTDNSWFCEKCNMNFPEPSYRYIANFQLIDTSGSNWATAFNETGVKIFEGVSANDLQRMQQENPDEFKRRTHNALFQQAVFRLKVKEEVYNEQPKLKMTVAAYKLVDFVEESRSLIRGITALQGR